MFELKRSRTPSIIRDPKPGLIYLEGTIPAGKAASDEDKLG